MEHEPGKCNEAADVLSRAPIQIVTPDDLDMHGLAQLIQRKHCYKAFVRNSLRIEIVDAINYLEKMLPIDAKDAQHIAAIVKEGYFVLRRWTMRVMKYQVEDVYWFLNNLETRLYLNIIMLHFQDIFQLKRYYKD